MTDGLSDHWCFPSVQVCSKWYAWMGLKANGNHRNQWGIRVADLIVEVQNAFGTVLATTTQPYYFGTSPNEIGPLIAVCIESMLLEVPLLEVKGNKNYHPNR